MYVIFVNGNLRNASSRSSLSVMIGHAKLLLVSYGIRHTDLGRLFGLRTPFEDRTNHTSSGLVCFFSKAPKFSIVVLTGIAETLVVMERLMKIKL